MHILLTRPLEDCSEMIVKFQSLDHKVSHLPLINVEKVHHEEIIKVLEKINHKDTYMRAHIERNILKVLEGDCETAIGAHSIIEGDKITVEAELFSLDGSQIFYEKKSGNVSKFKEIGIEVGNALKIKSNNSYKK